MPFSIFQNSRSPKKERPMTSNAQGTGGPIEEAAKDAVHHDGTNPVDHYAAEALVAAITSADQTPAQALLRAQQRFIAAQTRFIHAKDSGDMRAAQVELIIELLDYIGANDLSAALTMGERYITDMHQVLEQRGMI